MQLTHCLHRLLVATAVVLAVTLPARGLAASCAAIFPDAISSSKSAGSITFAWQSYVRSSPDNRLDTLTLNHNTFSNPKSCNTVLCTKSNTPVPELIYNEFPAGSAVSLGFRETRTLSPGNYGAVTLGTEAELRLNAGVYTFNGNVSLGYLSRFYVIGTGTAAIFINGTLFVPADTPLGDNNSALLVYASGSIDIGSRSVTYAGLYTDANFSLKSEGIVRGAVTAGGSAALESRAYVDYQAGTIASLESQGYCALGDASPELIAAYSLDEKSWNGTTAEVLESINGLNGSAVSVSGSMPQTVGSNPVISGSPGTCRYGEFNGANRGHIEIPDNNLLDMADSFSVAVWVNPVAYPSELATIASKDTNWEFHLRPSGQIFWWWGGGERELASSGTTVQLNRWQHIVITFANGEQKIYLDGAVVATRNSTAALTTNNLPLFIGTDYAYYSRTFNGALDELRIYEGVLSATDVATLMAETHPCPGYFDHFAISFDGGATASDAQAVTCESVDVTLIGHDADHNEEAPGLGTGIALNTSSGAGHWNSVDQGSLTDTGGGSANYTFASNSRATFSLNHPLAGRYHINVSGVGAEVATEDPRIDFYEAGFRFVDAAGNRIGSVANTFTQTSGVTSPVFYLQAIRTDNDTGVCTGVFAAGDDVPMRVAAECNDPLTCAGLRVSGTNNGLTGSVVTVDDNAASGASAYSTFNLRFGADSKAALTMSYRDVGAVSLHAQHDILNEDGTDSGVDMLGSSLPVVFKPADLVITQVYETGNASNTNPSTMNTGTGFIASGDAFTVVVESRNAQGSRTPNFGREQSPESITVNLDSLVFPAGGSLGALTGENGFALTSTPGQMSNTILRWNQVGSLRLQAAISDGDYVGAGDVTASASTVIGRFYPASFDLVSSSDYASNSCSSGGFTFLSEPGIAVGVQLQALNRQGLPASNYDNVDLSYVTGTLNFAAENNDDGNDLSDRLQNLPVISWDDGVGTAGATNVSLLRAIDGTTGNTLRDGPLAAVKLGVSVVDADGALLLDRDLEATTANDPAGCVVAGNCPYRQVGARLNLLFGRLVSEGRHGPEVSALPVPLYTQYWDGGSYRNLTQDSCTLLARSDVLLAGESTAVNLSAPVGSASSTASFLAISTTDIGLVNGDSGLIFSAPGQAGSFTLDIDLTVQPWLRHDWDGDGDYANDTALPGSTVSFGQYRGHDRIIYWHELLK